MLCLPESELQKGLSCKSPGEGISPEELVKT